MSTINTNKPTTDGELFGAAIISLIVIGFLVYFIVKSIAADLIIIPILLGLGVLFVVAVFATLAEDYSVNQRRIREREEKDRAIASKTDVNLASRFMHDITSRYDISQDIVELNRLPRENRELTIQKFMTDVIELFASDNFIDDEEESLINDVIQRTHLDKFSLENIKWWNRYQKLLFLKDLMNGKFPRSISKSSVSNINLMKTECALWVESGVEYMEQVTKRQYVGRSSGFSVRIAKGLYYRTGGFKGTPVETTEMKSYGQGTLTITNKNIYFYSGVKSIKIPFDKIISFTPYSDGLGVMKDGATAKPQLFVNLDGWFVYNVVSNVNALN